MDDASGDPAEGRIPAAEAAARLGVKRETLYAYVSRGLLSSRRGADGKTSTFDPAEIARLRAGRQRRRDGAVDTVIASSITRVADGSLSYRDRDVADLVPLGFEATAAWLWQQGPAGSPTAGRTEDRAAPLAGALPDRRAAPLAGALPDGVDAFDRLRAAAALASGLDPLRHDRRPVAVARVGWRLLDAYLDALPVHGRTRRGRLADRLWPRLTRRRATAARVAALDTALVLLADHDLASSTFAARIAASVRADPYSVVITGLGAVGGALHGAASTGVHDLFDRADRLGSPADALGELLRRGEPLPGFGHPVYRNADPRYRLLHAATRAAFADDPRLDLVDTVVGLARSRTDDVPNVDLALGALTWLASMDAGAGEVVFAISRTVGWLAHALEEYDEPPLRFRPRSLPR